MHKQQYPSIYTIKSINKMKTLLAIIFLFALPTIAFAQNKNSIVFQDNGKPVPVADPCVYEDNGVYYLTGTTGTTDGKHGFDYYYSKDLRTWTYGGPLFRVGENHPGVDCFWAPEVRKYNGKFYMTYSCYSNEHKGLVTCIAVSDYPDKGFKDLYVPWFAPKYTAIDCDIFIDDDGTPYLYYSKNTMLSDTIGVGEIYGVKLKKDLSGFVGDPVLISQASQKWEKVNWKKNRCNEGPWVIKHNGEYVMTYSANDTGFEYYGIGVQTAKSPLGKWKKYKDNPLMTTDLSKGISSPGHNSIVTSKDGKMYIVYHRHADPNCKKPNWDRVVCIDEIYFDKNGKLRIKE